MKLEIFNVGHGACAILTADNGKVALFDCGSDDDIGFAPSDHLGANGITQIEQFAISHFDHDHLQDLPQLRQKVSIRSILRNGSCTAAQVTKLKERADAPPTAAVQAALEMHGSYAAPIVPPLDLPNLQIVGWCNFYPRFQDSNNLSMVTFIHYHDLSICLPGDLECAGWEALLTYPAFCQNLQRVNVFIPSHHGRQNGYCPAVFDYCKPGVIIVSDGAIQYDSQKDLYRRHSAGFVTGTGETRYVLSTRCDGNIRIEKNGAAAQARLQWGWKPDRTVQPAPSLINMLAGYKPTPDPVSPFGLQNLLPPGPPSPIKSPSLLFNLTAPQKDDGLNFFRSLLDTAKK